MRLSLTVVLIASLALAGCGFRESRLNPRNWFGQSREVAAAGTESAANPLIPRRRGGLLSRPEKPDTSVLIGQVTELRIEPTPSGAIIYAAGVAVRQGAYDARLVPDSEELEPAADGVLSFAFRVTYPSRATAQGSAFSRTVHEAYSISREDLAGVQVIRVTAAQNARESRRR